MRRNAALVVAALAVVAIGLAAMHSASAEPTAVEAGAAYYPVASCGELVISGAPSAEYAVWGQDANGGYAVIGYGHLDSGGAAFLWVSEDGPADGAPPFVIEMGGERGGFLAIEEPGHEWWID